MYVAYRLDTLDEALQAAIDSLWETVDTVLILLFFEVGVQSRVAERKAEASKLYADFIGVLRK